MAESVSGQSSVTTWNLSYECFPDHSLEALCPNSLSHYQWWPCFLLLRENWNNQLEEFFWYPAFKSPNLPSFFVSHLLAGLSVYHPPAFPDIATNFLSFLLYIQVLFLKNNHSCKHWIMSKCLLLNNKYKLKIPSVVPHSFPLANTFSSTSSKLAFWEKICRFGFLFLHQTFFFLSSLRFASISEPYSNSSC